jgi:hypothetical protein
MTNNTLEQQIKSLDLKQNAIKILINSFYGAFGNAYFYFHNNEIAQSITLQGQDLIKFSIRAVNHYFLNKWHLDTELHEKLGISGHSISKVEKEAAVYTDTDSVAGDTIINSQKYGNVTISDLYDLCKINGSAGNTVAGHESVNANDRFLNWTETKGLHYSEGKRIIRHKVTKERWKLTTESGKEVIVTGDHSLIVFRDQIQLKIKARDINPETDLVLIVWQNDDLLNRQNQLIKITIMKLSHQFEKISKVEKLSDFEDEFVYDIEISDDSHSFIANEILVHNSVYVCFDYAIQSVEGLNMTDTEALQFCLAINRHRLNGYFVSAFEKYASAFNTDNRQTFELENLSRSGFWLAKKNYVLKVSYKDNKHEKLLDKESLIIKGLEAIQASYPIWARQHLQTLYSYLLDLGYNMDIERDLIPKLAELRKECDKLSIDEVAFNFSVRVYEQYVKSLNPLVLETGMPIYGRAAAYHNHVIKKTNNQKYGLIRGGSKIRFYYTAPNEYNFDVFAYSPSAFPQEFALPIDREQQFFRLIVEPINKLLVSIGFPELTPSLTRRVELIKSRTRSKQFTQEETFPLYAVDSQTLRYFEIPASCQEYVGNPDAKVPAEIFPIYLSSISRFGLTTVIVPKHELKKYRDRVAKKLGINVDDPFAIPIETMQSYLRENGWSEIIGNSDGGVWLQTEKLEKAMKQGKDYYKMGYSLEKAYKSATKPKPVKFSAE